MQTKKIGLLSLPNIIWLLFFIVIFCCVSGYKGVMNYIAIILVYLILLINLFSKDKRINKVCICIVGFMTFYFVTSLYKLDVENLVTYFSYNILVFSPLIVFGILSKTNNIIFFIRILKMTLLIWVIVGVVTLITYIAFPSIARMAAAYQDLYTGRIFGGYFYAYGSAILVVYLISNIFNSDITLKNRILILLLCIFLSIIVFLTESTITTLSMVIGIICCFFIDRNNYDGSSLTRLTRILIFILILAMIYILIRINVDSIMSWLTLRQDVLFFYRIKEIVNSLFYTINTNHVEKRSGLVEASWNLFCQRPLLGWGYTYGNVFSLGKTFGIGNHSEFFDTLARYGIIGSMPLFGTYYYGLKQYIKKYMGLFITICILIFLNPFMSFQSFLILFFVIPLFEKIFKSNKVKKGE